jgi:hypothetical protein
MYLSHHEMPVGSRAICVQLHEFGCRQGQLHQKRFSIRPSLNVTFGAETCLSAHVPKSPIRGHSIDHRELIGYPIDKMAPVNKTDQHRRANELGSSSSFAGCVRATGEFRRQCPHRVVLRQEHLTGQRIQEMRFLQPVHHGPLHFRQMQLHLHRVQAMIDGL